MNQKIENQNSVWYNVFCDKTLHRKEFWFSMNIVTQKAKKRQRIIGYSLKHGKSEASRKYVVPMDSNRRMYPNKIFVYIRGTHTWKFSDIS